MRPYLLVLLVAILSGLARAEGPPPPPPPTASAPVGRFPHVEVNAREKQVRVGCEALHCEAPLEFFCVVSGTNEHESVLRSKAKPSQVHTALLMLGLEAGEPVK